MSARVRLLLAAATLAVVAWHVGTGPFLDGVRAVDVAAVAAAAGLALVTTVACAWRWQALARGLGAELALGTAVAACYRSVFLNLTLPGGVAGDVHRGVRHGLRAVVWERSAGMAVQVVLTVAVLLVVPSPAEGAMPYVAVALAVAAAGLVLAARRRGPRVQLPARAWAGVVAASALVVGGHVATLIIAARAAGATAPLGELLPVALLVLLGAALPGVAGWGPREGVAAWAFAGAGLGASLGVATAVAYGVMVLVAALPGALVLLAGVARPAARIGATHA